MGLCMSTQKPAVIFQRYGDGYLEKITITNPTSEEKACANRRRRELIATMGKKNYDNIRPEAESTVTHYAFR